MAKIIIKDEHIQDAKTKGISVIAAAAKDYEGEIADRIAKDPRLKDFDVFQLAMMDAGISKSSQIKDFMATSDNRWLYEIRRRGFKHYRVRFGYPHSEASRHYLGDHGLCKAFQGCGKAAEISVIIVIQPWEQSCGCTI